MNRKSPVLMMLLVLGLLPLTAQEKQKLTFETGTDPILRQTLATARTWWLEDNTAVLYDMRKPPQERRLERLDPATGKRTPLFDVVKAESSFKGLFAEGKAPGLAPFPNAIAETGDRALYLVGGDIFVLNIATSTFMRVTDTPEEEKSALLSPNAQSVAFVRSNDLYVYDISQKQERRLTQDGSETLLNGTLSWVYWEEIFGRRDIGYWWSDDSKAIAFLQSDNAPVSVQHYVDIAPWTPTVTTQRYAKVGEKNPVVRVGIVEVSGGPVVWAALDRVLYEYIVRINWVPDNKRLAVRTMNRLQTELDVYFVDRTSGSVKFITKDTNEGWINVSDDFYFLRDGKHFVMSSERDGYEHLYRFTMDGKLVNQITKGDWTIRSSGGGAFWVHRAVTGIDEKNGWVYFTALEKSPLEKHLYRVNLDGKGMKRLSDEEGTHSISMSPDARWYFDQFSNISTPPSLTLRQSNGSKKLVLAAPNRAAFEKYEIQLPELLWIPARDGFKLPASVTKPKNLEPGKKYPVVVSVYGGPSAPTVANAFTYDFAWENILLSEGYISMKVDNRAATAISKKLENLLLDRSPGEVELNDLVDAVRWMKQQPFADPDRFGVTGWSGGGTNTILAMTRSTEFKAGIAGAGVTDFRFYDTKWGEAVMKTEKENLEGFQKASLLQYAKDLHGKLMLIHGTHDDNVHIQNTWQFVDELIKADKLFELMIYPMRKHGVGDPAGRKHLSHVTLDFWKRNL